MMFTCSLAYLTIPLVTHSMQGKPAASAICIDHKVHAHGTPHGASLDMRAFLVLLCSCCSIEPGVEVEVTVADA